MDAEQKWDESGILEAFAQSGALLTGHFSLRSGLHSDRFFQCALALRYPDLAERLCRRLVERLRVEVSPQVDAVIAPALGGLVVGHEVARAFGVVSIFAEKSDGVLAMRRFAIEAGQHYVVAEDVITRGGRVQETIDLVRAGGGFVSAVAVLVDRSAGQARFDVPVVSLVKMAPTLWDPGDCPLCEAGIPLVHPGS